MGTRLGYLEFMGELGGHGRKKILCRDERVEPAEWPVLYSRRESRGLLAIKNTQRAEHAICLARILC